jgi:D-sedoheptulose 7-phosphate isomerase
MSRTNLLIEKKMIKIDFIKYITKFKNLLDFDLLTLNSIENLYKILKKYKKNSGKIIIFGNGGSASIASHFSVDMTKNAKIKTINLNEYNLITCFANDYGFENWISKAIEFYSEKEDLIILISSRGESKNMIKAARKIKKLKLKLITFTGFKKNNSLKKLGDINIWINSKNYNYIENVHQIIMLSIVDFFNKKILK